MSGELFPWPLAPQPHQLLMDRLAARDIEPIETLLILRHVENGVCPKCGEELSSYQLVFVPDPSSFRGVFFRHPNSILSCYRDFP